MLSLPKIVIPVLSLMLWGVDPVMKAQTASYTHPVYEMHFTASASWEQKLSRDHPEVLRVTNRNRNMEVFLSFFPGCTQPEEQLRKISGQRGLICQDDPFDTVLNGRHSVLMRGVCLQGRRPFHRMITGIPGKDGLYVMEICCPEECYASHRKEMESILGSLVVGS